MHGRGGGRRLGRHKCMTVTSGPGFSLMMENIGLGVMMETPCVVVNVQRGGPSTGLPTMVGQADMMQARWGSHGDYEMIAVCPQLAAGGLRPDHRRLQPLREVPRAGHVRHDGRVRGPHDREGRHPARATRSRSCRGTAPRSHPENTCPTSARRTSWSPSSPGPGTGYRFHTTGLTHDERGYPVMTLECQDENWSAPGGQDPGQRRRDRPATKRRARRRRGRGRLLRHHRPGRPDGHATWRGSRASGSASSGSSWSGPSPRSASASWPRGQGVRGPGDQPRPDGARGGALRRRARPSVSRCLTPAAAVHDPEGSDDAIVGGLSDEHGPDPATTQRTSEHPIAPFLRMDRMPHIWCPTCGIGTVVKCYASALESSGLDLDKVAIVSGIGCTGRVAGYMKLDAFHTTHGRAIPFATGLKLGNPELKVTVFSGDGDLIGIGGNHLIHAARRNMDLTGRLREQLHLRHDRRPERPDHPRGRPAPRPCPSATSNARSTCRTSWPAAAPTTWRAGPACTSGG